MFQRPTTDYNSGHHRTRSDDQTVGGTMDLWGKPEGDQGKAIGKRDFATPGAFLVCSFPLPELLR